MNDQLNLNCDETWLDTGALTFFPDGDGWVCGLVVAVDTPRNTITVNWGDCEREVPAETCLQCSRCTLHPSAGACVGKRFKDVEEILIQLRRHAKC